MASVNRVHILGNLGRDPELRSFPDGGAICNIVVATSRKWKGKDGQIQEKTEWSRIVFHGRLAEIAGQFLRKGKQVYVEGRLDTRKWTDKEGKDNYTTEIIAENMQLLGGRDEGEGRQEVPARQAPARQAAAPQAKASSEFDDFDKDDIPF